MDLETLNLLIKEIEDIKNLFFSNVKGNISEIVNILNKRKKKLDKDDTAEFLDSLLDYAAHVAETTERDTQRNIDSSFFINSLERFLKYLNAEKRKLNKNVQGQAKMNDIDKIFINFANELEKNLIPRPIVSTTRSINGSGEISTRPTI